ncbi:restriction endonuclease subunit S [Vibrio parahaemolyticus]|nr:restriction endonuclease subunit S [Vibrio parahaemolyticus]MDF5026995.1 restriction endonuclease subunit S [Vibrio parahaemolyticus]MDF5061133.1 restriction endonuclease subunit S [Vibrio parahaemolyticus]MDF5146662.1 restriction endonuclease subunit S [Vibrio parahaemolyticus]MDF5195584.1 restriction endonuclease subunit S [Vibrio parahaemolyticus]
MSFEKKPITEIVDFNPKRAIKKGSVAPFIDMAALPVSSRDVDEITEKEFKSGGAKFCNGDTLFARITPCLENGKTAKVSGLDKNQNGFGSTEFIVMSAKDQEHDEDYVYYLARLPEFRAYAKARMEGTSGRQRVPWQSLAEFEYPLPSKEQRKLAGNFFRAIDDKISLNTQTNQTLEQMAQAIFKSWFVDFDPVKAKINGEQPEGMDAATASLFPEKLVESELGLIPEGWDAVQVGDIVQRLKPKKRYTKKQVEPYGKTPVYEQGASILLGFHNDDAGFDASPEDPVFIFGDHTCITHLSCSKFDISSNVIPLKGSVRPTIWTYYAIQGKQEFQEYRRHWSEFIIKDVVLPPVELAEKYAELVTTKYLMMESLKRQSKELDQLRDTLLPKLLSGEIELGQAQELAEVE